jgi:hypothetical protein
VVREGIVAAAVLAVVPILAYLFCGGERAFAFLTFHSARGLQLESSTAWLVFLVESGTTLGHAYGSYTLRGALADRIASATTVATAAALGLAVLIAARGFRRAATSPRPPDRNQLVTHLVGSSLLVWLGFILFTKVGSPQYLLWLAPLVALLPLRGADRRWVTLLLAGMVLTTLVYPCLYHEVKGEPTGAPLTWSGPTALGLSLLAAKSIVFATAFAWLAVLVWRAPWLSTTSPNPEVV